MSVERRVLSVERKDIFDKQKGNYILFDPIAMIPRPSRSGESLFMTSLETSQILLFLYH